MRSLMPLVAALLMLLGGGAAARDLPADLRALIEHFQAGRRTAEGYLRTGNGDLGAFEIERLRDRLAADRAKLAPRSDVPLMIAVARTESLVAVSLQAADGGDIDRARSLLGEAAKPLDVWRKDNGIRLFSDCIAEIAAAYDRLGGGRSGEPDLADTEAGRRIEAAADRTVAALDRCEIEAGDSLRRDPQFRRLFDGMRASLRQLRDAIATRDAALLHRLLIEQRSFEELLLFRFG